MNNFNNIISIVREAMPLVQSGIPALVGGFVTAMFLRGNTNRQEFEKIKIGKVKEALDALVERRELTLTELVKCTNLLKIAKLADEAYSNFLDDEEKAKQSREFDFDWFLRFFESAGNISNENMQLLWARVLAGEVVSPEGFSLRTLDILHNITSKEAELFLKLMPFVVSGDDGAYCAYSEPYVVEHIDSKKIYAQNMLLRFGISRYDFELLISRYDFELLIDCQLLTEARYSSYNPNEEEGALPLAIENGDYRISVNCTDTEEELIIGQYNLTNSAKQIMTIAEFKPNNDYLFVLANEIKENLSSDYSIKVFKSIQKSGSEPIYDESHDMLAGDVSESNSKITRRKTRRGRR